MQMHDDVEIIRAPRRTVRLCDPPAATAEHSSEKIASIACREPGFESTCWLQTFPDGRARLWFALFIYGERANSGAIIHPDQLPIAREAIAHARDPRSRAPHEWPTGPSRAIIAGRRWIIIGRRGRDGRIRGPRFGDDQILIFERCLDALEEAAAA